MKSLQIGRLLAARVALTDPPSPAALRADKLAEAEVRDERELRMLARPGVGQQALDAAEPQPVGGDPEQPGRDAAASVLLGDPEVVDVGPADERVDVAMRAQLHFDESRDLVAEP